MDILIPEDQLAVDETLLTRLSQKVPAVNWQELEEDVRQAYARHFSLLDGELRNEIGAGALSDPAVFYNAYYWILMFAKRYQARHGFDAGVEQQAFKILEHAPPGVDWGVVEQVHEAAQRA